jgi:hypothetical protein
LRYQICQWPGIPDVLNKPVPSSSCTFGPERYCPSILQSSPTPITSAITVNLMQAHLKLRLQMDPKCHHAQLLGACSLCTLSRPFSSSMTLDFPNQDLTEHTSWDVQDGGLSTAKMPFNISKITPSPS